MHINLLDVDFESKPEKDTKEALNLRVLDGAELKECNYQKIPCILTENQRYDQAICDKCNRVTAYHTCSYMPNNSCIFKISKRRTREDCNTCTKRYAYQSCKFKPGLTCHKYRINQINDCYSEKECYTFYKWNEERKQKNVICVYSMTNDGECLGCKHSYPHQRTNNCLEAEKGCLEYANKLNGCVKLTPEIVENIAHKKSQDAYWGTMKHLGKELPDKDIEKESWKYK